MSKSRILIIENSVDVTGALNSIIRTADDLKDTFDFRFVIPTNAGIRPWIEDKGFTTIYELPMNEISRRFSSLVIYIPCLLLNAIRLWRIIKREKIDLVHVNDLFNMLPVVFNLFGGKVPYVCHIRFLPTKFPKVLFNFWMKLHLRHSKKIITVSLAVKKLLPNHPKITVIPDEIPMEERYPEMIEPRIDKSTLTFLYLSNFMVGKGHNFALAAFAKIHNQIPNWKLRFVGGDMGLLKNVTYRKSLQEMAKELGIFEKTDWLGFTKEVELEYKQADVVLNFSESESFSLTCLEAMYFGRPVIATDCGGPSEIIENERTGFLVKNRDIESMAEAMLFIANKKTLRGIIGTEARKSVMIKFSIENTSFKVRKVYSMILDKS